MKHSKPDLSAEPIHSDQLFRLYQRTLAGFGLILFAVTWKLWTPQTVFPQIPFFESLIGAPAVIDWICLVLVGGSLTVTAITHSAGVARWSSLVFSAAAIVLILLDQHRLQPWAYQFIVFSVVMATTTPRRALFWMRWIVISIYVYSAISKFDYQFVHTIGDQFFSELARFSGIDVSTTPWNTKLRFILLFPTGELLVGIALAIPKTRWIGVIAAIVLHSLLLLLLGPWGLGHQPGVLVWNLFFLTQVILLFGAFILTPWRSTSDKNPGTGNQKPAHRLIATTIALVALLFPTTRLMGICDHWPAWEVYAPHCSRVRITSPPSVQSPRSPPYSLSKWSLMELAVPIYPQARFQLGVAMAVSENENLDREMQVTLEQESDRLTGARETTLLVGHDSLKMATRGYWLNTKARKIYFATMPPETDRPERP